VKKLLILGTGCAKCNKLAALTEEAAQALGIEYELEKITDIVEITKFDVMMTPALVVDGATKCSGRVPSVAELQKLIAG